MKKKIAIVIGLILTVSCPRTTSETSGEKHESDQTSLARRVTDVVYCGPRNLELGQGLMDSVIRSVVAYQTLSMHHTLDQDASHLSLRIRLKAWNFPFLARSTITAALPLTIYSYIYFFFLRKNITMMPLTKRFSIKTEG